MSDVAEYSIDRDFNAPRDLVWQAWTKPEILSRWYGPNVETIIHEFDLKPGGIWRNEMKWGDNSKYSKMIFETIDAPVKIAWREFSTDEKGEVISNPMMPDWPREFLIASTFTEKAGADKAVTTVQLTITPLNASDAEIACFKQAMANMSKGWGAGFGVLDSLLAELTGN